MTPLLKVGLFYYFKEKKIYPSHQTVEWLMQLKELPSEYNQKRGSSIVFKVFTTNDEDFCNPGLNIADIKCTTMYCLFKSTSLVMKEVYPKDFRKYLNFPVYKKEHCQGVARRFYHPQLAAVLPLDVLPLLMGLPVSCPSWMTVYFGSMEDIIAKRFQSC